MFDVPFFSVTRLASHPNFDAVINCIIRLLSLRSCKSVVVRTYILQMLPTILDLDKGAHGIMKVVERLVTDMFPSVSSHLKRGSTEAIEYAMQLKELLVTCVDEARSHNAETAIEVGCCMRVFCTL